MTILSIVWALDTTVTPYLVRLIIDTFTQFDSNRAAAWGDLRYLLLYLIAFWIFVEFCFRSKNFLLAVTEPKLAADIRMAMFDHIQRHSPKYFNEHFSGSLANKISDMTTEVIQIFNHILVFIPAFIASLLSIAFFFNVNPVLALIFSVWIIFHFGIWLAFSPRCIQYADSHGEARSTLGGKIVDSLTNNFAVNLFYRFAFEKGRMAPLQRDEQMKNFRSLQLLAWIFLYLTLFFLIGSIAVNGYVVALWLENKISTGETIQVFNTTVNMSFLMWISGEMIPQFFRSAGVATQALSVMKDPQDILDYPGATDLIVNKGEIIFENVSFKYGDKALFQNKHVHIQGGEKVGLVGYSGAGKSSFVNLILRFHLVHGGRILIDGTDITKVTLESLRKQVALIPQDPLLFHRTLMENIQYGDIEATEEEVITATKLAHCEEFIQRCPGGYQALVGERGTKLSGGERQRIAIARAMLAKAPILILDEATSALDSVTESYIQESLDNLMQNRTTLVIAHRLSTLSKMDRILVFDQGKIVEEGSHAALIAQGGRYAQMWQMQAGGFLPDQ
ncbi:MAG: ABC transporter ATP-binding protein [Chlamydiia bacterium]